MMTPWTADRWVHSPMAYEIGDTVYVSPAVYERLRGHVADNGNYCVISTRIQVCQYLSDYRNVEQPTFKGWWLT